MPTRPTYPGVYIEEIPSGVRTVTGVATSTAAFIGTFERGLHNEAVRLLSQADFEREFGGQERNSEASYAVQQFFLNGGSEAYVVRIGHDGSGTDNTAISASTIDLLDGDGAPLITVTAGRRIRGQSATNPGRWGNNLRIVATHNGTAADSTFNLVVSELRIQGTTASVVTSEAFNNLTTEPNTANNVIDVVNQGSRLVQLTMAVAVTDPFPLPAATGMVSGELPAARPAFGNLDDISVTVAGFGAAAQALTIAPDVPANPSQAVRETQAAFTSWAQRLQAAIRAVASRFAPELQPYFAGASVSVIGNGTTGNPRRLVVTPGFGSRAFAADTVFTFSGADVANYRLEPATGTPTATQHLDTVGAAYALDDGDDGTVVDSAGGYLVPLAAFLGNPNDRTGIWALEDVDLFNILSIPDAPRLAAAEARALYSAAEGYVLDRRAMVIVDIPENVRLLDQMHAWLGDNENLRHPNAAVYYPRTIVSDPLNQGRTRSIAASGTIAGLWARTDAARGVWKAPAGTEARLRNVESLAYQLTDLENGTLNPLGVNALRTFPIYSNICWGARTLDGADLIASDFKYIPVRRITLFIEESLYRGTKWVVFEPNDEPLWAQIRMNVGSFMQDLFRQGAFQGTTAREAFFVKCDKETTTQSDIDNGIVNIEVGFAPLKPAEFVILKIRQIVRRPEA